MSPTRRGRLVELVMESLQEYYASGKSLRELSETCGVSKPLLYKYLDNTRGETPQHKTLMKLIKGLEIPDSAVYASIMVDEKRAKKVVAAESAYPDILDNVLDILSGSGSPEAVEKLRIEAQFLKKTHP